MKNLSEPFVRRPAMTVVLTVSALLFGILAYQALPVNDLPAVDYPVIQVSVSYPGATPDTMANNVATPLERQFAQIPGLELVTSKSSQGYCSFVLQFALSKTVDSAATDVQAAINQAQGSLPTDLPSPPSFTKDNPNDKPILYVALSSDTLTDGQLYDYANTEVAQRISLVQGVSKVDIFGSKSAVRIKVDPSKLATRGLTVQDVAASINAVTSYQGSGQFDGPNRTYLLQPQGQLSTAEGYRNQIIKDTPGGPVYLKDVANVLDSVADERIRRNFWVRGIGEPPATVVLPVSRSNGANAVEVAGQVRTLLKQLRTELPGSISLIPVYDRSKTIVESVTEVETTLFIAFVLVIGVIYIFLGRAVDTLIPLVALPLSLLLTFCVMQVLGYSLDNLSLLALTLAIGFLVDDAIVFLENTVRLMEQGQSAMQATLNSATEIAFTILAMTLSLAAVFLPLVFMPGLIGRIFREFGVVIIVSILASGVVSLTLTPLMCSRMLARRGEGQKKTLMERAFLKVEKPVLDFYGSTLHFFLDHKWISAVTWVVCLIGTYFMFTAVPKAFLPKGDSGFIFGLFIAKEGSSPKEMYAIQDRVNDVMRSNENVDLAFTLTGFSSRFSSNQGLALAFLKPVDERPGIQDVAQQLAGTMMQKVPGVIPIMNPNPVLQISTGATSNQQGQFAYAISGINPDEVYATAQKMMGKLQDPNSGFAGFQSVSSDLFNHTPALQINILRDQAATYGISPQRILNLLRQAYSQNYVYLIKTPTDQYQVIVEVNDKDRSRPADLSLLYIKSDDGRRTVPLNTVANWTETLGPQAVNHINSFTSVTIFFNLKPGVSIGTATEFVQKVAADVVPQNVRGGLQGEALLFSQTVGQFVVLAGLAVFVMYVILAILYESYLHPITVLSALPVALVGGLATLLLFGSEASLYAFIGMFMLMGIVKKNGIMLIDFALMRQDDGLDRVAAIHEASIERFRPIMMTTLAALFGAVPIALGFGADAASRRPLGLVIVGGLIVSQLITLYVLPAIYLYMEELQEGVLDKYAFTRSRRVQRELGEDADEADDHPELDDRDERGVREPAYVGGNGNGNGHDH